MNKQLSKAISRISALPEDRQEAMAAVILDVLDNEEAYVELTPEQIAELDRRLDQDDFASEDETREFFASLKA